MANPIAVLTIALYLVSTTLVGILMVRRSRGSDDWAVAGGRMGVLLIAVGIRHFSLPGHGPRRAVFAVPTTAVPLVVVPPVSLLTSERREGRDAFYRTIRTAPA